MAFRLFCIIIILLSIIFLTRAVSLGPEFLFSKTLRSRGFVGQETAQSLSVSFAKINNNADDDMVIGFMIGGKMYMRIAWDFQASGAWDGVSFSLSDFVALGEVKLIADFGPNADAFGTLAVADINRNGRPDVLVFASSTGYTYLCGLLTAGTGINYFDDSNYRILWDLDEKGDPSTAAPGGTSLAGSFYRYHYDCGKQVPAATPFVRGGGVDLRDVDGDGRLDAIFALAYSYEGTLYKIVKSIDQTGAFTLPASSFFDGMGVGYCTLRNDQGCVTMRVGDLSLGDFNNDGKTDLAVVHTDNAIGYLRVGWSLDPATGKPDSWSAPYVFTTSARAVRVAVGTADMQADGVQDMFLALSEGDGKYFSWMPTTWRPAVYACSLAPEQCDADEDSVPDSDDNCIFVSNIKQADGDSDGVGDFCDTCADLSNAAQTDSDGDGVGDACDSDDGDGVYVNDNCPLHFNPQQLDTDHDGVGDVCDNCPSVANSDQRDSNGDGIGDACSNDSDGDGVPNSADRCPRVSDPLQEDTDGDGVGDKCDNCPLVPNPSQADSDFDGLGDACDSGLDSDFDGVKDQIDNCPNVANADQADADSDGTGDACNGDDDGDDIPDHVDNCPLVPNHNQANLFEGVDPTGDACRSDFDGDGVPDSLDSCPANRAITKPTFSDWGLVPVSTESLSHLAAATQTCPWIALPGKQSVMQGSNLTCSDPYLLVAPAPRLGPSFQLSVRVFVADEEIGGTIGVVFWYQTNRAYYLMEWGGSTIAPAPAGWLSGVRVRRISQTSLADAASFRSGAASQVLFSNPTVLRTPDTAYRISICSPDGQHVSLVIAREDSPNGPKLLDVSFLVPLVDGQSRAAGGKIGLFSSYTRKTYFSGVDYSCLN